MVDSPPVFVQAAGLFRYSGVKGQAGRQVQVGVSPLGTIRSSKSRTGPIEFAKLPDV